MKRITFTHQYGNDEIEDRVFKVKGDNNRYIVLHEVDFYTSEDNNTDSYDSVTFTITFIEEGRVVYFSGNIELEWVDWKWDREVIEGLESFGIDEVLIEDWHNREDLTQDIILPRIIGHNPNNVEKVKYVYVNE